MPAKMSASGLQEQMMALNKIGIALTKEQDLNQLLTLILTESRQFTNAEAGSLYVREGEQLRFSVTQNEVLEARKKAEQKAQRKPLEVAPSTFTGFYVSLDKSSLAGYVGVTAKVLNLPDAYKIPSGREYKFNRSFDEKNNYRTKSMLIVPMKDAWATWWGSSSSSTPTRARPSFRSRSTSRTWCCPWPPRRPSPSRTPCSPRN